jgi:hypothetical protein
MDISTKSFIYKTYCRPSMLYGSDLIELNEKTINLSREYEGIILKRILVVPKTSRTSYVTYKFGSAGNIIIINDNEIIIKG